MPIPPLSDSDWADLLDTAQDSATQDNLLIDLSRNLRLTLDVRPRDFVIPAPQAMADEVSAVALAHCAAHCRAMSN